MLTDGLIDACMGLLPGVRTVTLVSPGGDVNVELDARKEDITEETAMFAAVESGTEACVWFFPAGQAGFVRPRMKYDITDAGGDGRVWRVIKDDLVIQSRGVAVVATIVRSATA